MIKIVKWIDEQIKSLNPAYPDSALMIEAYKLTKERIMQDIKIPCIKCEGSGGLTVDGYEVDCNRCRGNGYIYVCPTDLNRVKDYCEEQIYYHNKHDRVLSDVGKGSLMAYGQVLSFIESIQEKK